MRTLALIKVNSIRGALLGVILLLALMMFFVIGAKPSHAASLDGEYTVTEDFSPGVSGVPTNLEATQFELYRVGHFVVGYPYVVLDDAPYTVGVELPYDADQTNRVAWTKQWLECALTLNNNIMSAEDKPDPIMIDVNAQGEFHKDNLANGLYLLRGNSQLVKDYPKVGQKSYWWPQPMLISILNSDVDVYVKPMTGLVHRLKVQKVWQWPDGFSEELKKLVRPDSITVKLFYNGKLKETVVLNEQNNWSYEWDAAQNESNPALWSVNEVNLQDEEEFQKNFVVTELPKFIDEPDPDAEGGVEVITITNKYARYELEIEKIFEAYVENGEGNSTSLVFELSGYSDNDCEDRVYHTRVGLQVDKSKGDVQKLNVKDIPRGLKHLKVKEVYSGNYTPDKEEKEAELHLTQNGEKGVYSVSFTNKPDNTTHGSGVINKFKLTNIDPHSPYEFDKSLGDDK